MDTYMDAKSEVAFEASVDTDWPCTRCGALAVKASPWTLPDRHHIVFSGPVGLTGTKYTCVACGHVWWGP
jgi:hypothetical protein